MIRMYFRVVFLEANMSGFNHDTFTNEEDAVEYAESVCNKYSRQEYVEFDVVKYYEWRKD